MLLILPFWGGGEEGIRLKMVTQTVTLNRERWRQLPNQINFIPKPIVYLPLNCVSQDPGHLSVCAHVFY